MALAYFLTIRPVTVISRWQLFNVVLFKFICFFCFLQRGYLLGIFLWRHLQIVLSLKKFTHWPILYGHLLLVVSSDDIYLLSYPWRRASMNLSLTTWAEKTNGNTARKNKATFILELVEIKSVLYCHLFIVTSFQKNILWVWIYVYR